MCGRLLLHDAAVPKIAQRVRTEICYYGLVIKDKLLIYHETFKDSSRVHRSLEDRNMYVTWYYMYFKDCSLDTDILLHLQLVIPKVFKSSGSVPSNPDSNNSMYCSCNS